MFRHPFFQWKTPLQFFWFLPSAKSFMFSLKIGSEIIFQSCIAFTQFHHSAMFAWTNNCHAKIRPITIKRSVNHLLLEWEDVDNAWCKFGESGDWGTIVSDEGSGLRIAYWSVTPQSAPVAPLRFSHFLQITFPFNFETSTPKSFSDIFYTSSCSQIYSIVLLSLHRY